MGRKCEACGYQMPFARRRTKHPQTGALVCDGCLPGSSTGPGRPVGYHGSKETPMTTQAAFDLEHCGSCGSEIGDAGLIRREGRLVCADGCKTAELSRAEVRYVQDNFYGTSGKDRVTWQNSQGMGALQVAVYVVDDRTLILRSHITKHGPDIILRDLSQSEAQAKVNEFWPGLTPYNRWASIQRQAHDSGDGETIYHCPFCGAGQVIGRSDGTVACGFCESHFTVQVQPKHPSMPQTLDGTPVNDPSMPGDGVDPFAADIVDESAVGDEVLPEDEPSPFTSGLRTATGAVLSEEDYLAHLALAVSPDRQGTLAEVRRSRASK